MTVKEFVSKIMDVQKEAMARMIDDDSTFPEDIKEFEITDPDYKSELARIIAEFKEQL